MNKPWTACLATLAIAFSPAIPAQTPVESEPPPAAEDELETLLVVGEQPGPGLWKVSKGDRVMWILGTSGPLPKDMKWRSKDVEARVAESQEVLYRGFAKVGPDIGMFRAITLLPAMLKAAKNPNGATLKEVLPEETYARWAVLRKKYLDDDKGAEKWRPTFAEEVLRSAAVRKSGLGRPFSVESVVSKAAKKNKVRIRRLPIVERKVEVENPRRILKSARNVELNDVECFSRSLERLESDIETMKRGANAWATGDLESLREVTASFRGMNCSGQLMQALNGGQLAGETGAKQVLEELQAQSESATKEVERNWLEAVDRALATNRTTFAVLPIGILLRPDGYVAKLRERGYEVEEP
jgi:hypothetical protein